MLLEETKTIEVENNHGQVCGCVHYIRERLHNWLFKVHAPDVINALAILSDRELLPVAILKNINVEPSYQGQGYGTDLLEQFIDEASILNVQTIILEAYADEAKHQMDLYNFYAAYGFELVPGSARIMVLY